VTFYKLLERFGSATDALHALPELSRRGGRKRAVSVCPKAAAEREWEATEQAGAVLVARGEADYPPLLAQTEDAPPLLSIKGHAHLLSKKGVAIVGARNASTNGQRFAAKLATDLGDGGFLVVSGMARGIDGAAHAGALASGTVAVLAGGVDVIYPKENRDLYDSLCERGAIISEIAPGVQPTARHFPRRNRLISGMSRGIVVVEAAPRSGSLITARLAGEQGREVFAVPGSPLDPRAKGTNKLLREGATLVESADDVIDGLNQAFRTPMSEPYPIDFAGQPATETPPEMVGEARRHLEKTLGPTPIGVDEVLRNGSFSAAVVATALLELELAGRLERHPGNKVSLLMAP
jgi:DNA processing protein